jgi:hypothetical protein
MSEEGDVYLGVSDQVQSGLVRSMVTLSYVGIEQKVVGQLINFSLSTTPGVIDTKIVLEPNTNTLQIWIIAAENLAPKISDRMKDVFSIYFFVEKMVKEKEQVRIKEEIVDILKEDNAIEPPEYEDTHRFVI